MYGLYSKLRNRHYECMTSFRSPKPALMREPMRISSNSGLRSLTCILWPERSPWSDDRWSKSTYTRHIDNTTIGDFGLNTVNLSIIVYKAFPSTYTKPLLRLIQSLSFGLYKAFPSAYTKPCLRLIQSLSFDLSCLYKAFPSAYTKPFLRLIHSLYFGLYKSLSFT